MISPSENPELADSILSTVAQVGLPYFIMGGTLLGLYRDGKYIPEDNDLDIAMMREHFTEMPLILYAHGIITDTHGKHEGRHYWKDGMLLDIRWVEPEGFYEFYDALKYNDATYRAPYPIEEYLEWKYGATWPLPLQRGEYVLQHEH